MASYPGAKVHRVSRRKLGRGQHVQLPSATVTAAAVTTTVTLTFSQSVVVGGPIPLVLGTPQTSRFAGSDFAYFGDDCVSGYCGRFDLVDLICGALFRRFKEVD